MEQGVATEPCYARSNWYQVRLSVPDLYCVLWTVVRVVKKVVCNTSSAGTGVGTQLTPQLQAETEAHQPQLGRELITQVEDLQAASDAASGGISAACKDQDPLWCNLVNPHSGSHGFRWHPDPNRAQPPFIEGGNAASLAGDFDSGDGFSGCDDAAGSRAPRSFNVRSSRVQ